MLSKTLPDMSKFTDEQLVQIVRDGSAAGGIAPSLALTELQRRKQLRAGANRPPEASMAEMAAPQMPVQQFQVGGGVPDLQLTPVPSGTPQYQPWIPFTPPPKQPLVVRGAPPKAQEKKDPALPVTDEPQRAGLGMAVPPKKSFEEYLAMVRGATGEFDGEAPKALTPEELQGAADAWSQRYGTDYSKYEGGLTKRREEMGDRENRAFKAGLLAAFGRGVQGGPNRGAAWGSGIISGIQAADGARDKFNREARDIDGELMGIAKARAAEGRGFGDMALRMETENRGARRDYTTAKRNWNKDTGLTALGLLKSDEAERRAASRGLAGAAAGGEKLGKPDPKLMEQANAHAEQDPALKEAADAIKTASTPELRAKAYERYNAIKLAGVRDYLQNYAGEAQYGNRTPRAGAGGVVYLPNKK